MSIKTILFGIVFTLTAHNAAIADTVTLNPNHPEQHIVIKGDTLWDISATFLADPWLWPEIWHINPEIANPHLIFPGDKIILTFVDGKPVIKVIRDKPTPDFRGKPVKKLSPTPRASKLESAIPTIPLDAIKQFMKHPSVIGKEELDNAPYIVASEEGRLVSGTEDKIYVRGISDKEFLLYNVIRPGQAYRNTGKNRKEILGYEAVKVAQAKIIKYGDPATLYITKSSREVLIGDRLVPVSNEAQLDSHFIPHAPAEDVEGQFIAVFDGVSRISQFQIVVINLGIRENIEPGHVLAVFQTGRVVRDTIGPRKMGRKVKLPDERAGTVMVIRPYDRLSYVLVMEATRDLAVFDTVKNP